MAAPRPFLTARWSNLCIVSYAVPRKVLEPLLPPGLMLDTRAEECFASLVAFDFLNSRVLGVKWPGLVNFPEVNLRFYVREGDRRGVCFVRELVPSRIVAWVARAFYNEPYWAAKMSSHVEQSGASVNVRHRFSRGAAVGEIHVKGIGPGTVPPEDSVEHFFKEHEWGYGTGRRGGLLRYRVEHPVWAVYRVESCAVKVDWVELYGSAWGWLNGREPTSVVLAAGSEVKVFPLGVEKRGQALGN